jgi:hypothetical protein
MKMLPHFLFVFNDSGFSVFRKMKYTEEHLPLRVMEDLMPLRGERFSVREDNLPKKKPSVCFFSSGRGRLWI